MLTPTSLPEEWGRCGSAPRASLHSSCPRPALLHPSVPAIGQVLVAADSSAGVPNSMFDTQVVLCQSGESSLMIPKFDPPTISR